MLVPKAGAVCDLRGSVRELSVMLKVLEQVGNDKSPSGELSAHRNIDRQCGVTRDLSGGPEQLFHAGVGV